MARASKGRHANDVSWTRVKIGETRAKGIVDLAWFETGVRQGDPIDALPVYVTVSCGRPVLPIGDTSFKLATWQVLIRLQLENAGVKRGSYRQVKTQQGSFQSQSTSKLLTIREHAFALGLEAGAKASVLPPNIAASIFAKLKLKTGKKLTDSTTATTKRTTEIILIGQFGEAIAIGDPVFGDPHKAYGLLSHTYPKEVREDDEPLFILEPINQNKPMLVTVMTAVPFDKLCLLSGDANERILQFARNEKIARKEIVRRASEAIEAHEMLRRQMLRGELVSRVSQNQKSAGLPVRDGEFAVMVETFEIRPNVGGEAGGA
jgi:hypothetical protein